MSPLLTALTALTVYAVLFVLLFVVLSRLRLRWSRRAMLFVVPFEASNLTDLYGPHQ